VSRRERQELRDVAAVLYYGGNPADHEETAELWQKWHFLFEMFEFCKHSKYASLTQLPAAGGILDQPAKTMQVFQVLQGCWVEKLESEIQKIKNTRRF
jgi:hypothetical protein